MIVKRLKAVVYASDGRSWREEITNGPSWREVETSIRRLDKFVYPFVWLCPSDSKRDENRLEVIGGEGDYSVAGTVGSYYQRRLMNPNGTEQLIKVWTSDQGLHESDLYICHDIEVVLRAAKYYFDHGSFEPSMPWE